MLIIKVLSETTCGTQSNFNRFTTVMTAKQSAAFRSTSRGARQWSDSGPLIELNLWQDTISEHYGNGVQITVYSVILGKIKNGIFIVCDREREREKMEGWFGW